jgi:hypothetical protein
MMIKAMNRQRGMGASPMYQSDENNRRVADATSTRAGRPCHAQRQFQSEDICIPVGEVVDPASANVDVVSLAKHGVTDPAYRIHWRNRAMPGAATTGGRSC